MANGNALPKESWSRAKRSKQVAQENAIRRRVCVTSRIRDDEYGLVAHGNLAAAHDRQKGGCKKRSNPDNMLRARAR